MITIAKPGSEANDSLRRRLLFNLLPWLIVALMLAATASYWAVNRAVQSAFDQSLSDTAAALIAYVRVTDGRLGLDVPADAERVLRADEFETVWFALFDAQGQWVSGDQSIAALWTLAQNQRNVNPAARVAASRIFVDGRLGGQDVRAVKVDLQSPGSSGSVVVAETVTQRNQRQVQAALGLLTPLVLLAVVGTATVWWGIQRSLVPIRSVAQALGARSSTNLAAIPEPEVVAELRPLINAVNSLLARLKVAQSTQERFIADAAHQLRTPLAGLSMLLELGEGETDPKRRSERLNQARAATTRTIHLAQQLLTLSAAQTDNRHEEQFERFALIALIEELAPQWAMRSEVQGIEISFEIAPCELAGDRFMIGEALANLVDNALSYCPAGSTIIVRCYQEAHEQVVIEVQDNGPGVAPEHLGHLTERFYRPAGSAGTGSGLGLSIVEAVMQRHNANLSLTNLTPHGLSCKMIFPLPPG